MNAREHKRLAQTYRRIATRSCCLRTQVCKVPPAPTAGSKLALFAPKFARPFFTLFLLSHERWRWVITLALNWMAPDRNCFMPDNCIIEIRLGELTRSQSRLQFLRAVAELRQSASHMIADLPPLGLTPPTYVCAARLQRPNPSCRLTPLAAVQPYSKFPILQNSLAYA